jgi:IS1 family transposase/transposase-like protein
MQETLMVVESVVLTVVVGLLLRGPAKRRWKRWQEGQRGKPKKRPYTLRPRSPKDCLDCRVEAQLKLPEVTRTTQAWSAVKSPRGRPKTYDSDGQACMNRVCKYYGDTDGLHHALRRDGSRNKCEATPQWECGACLSQHTARLGTPMYGLKTPSERVKLATHLAMKGNSIADISEVLGHSPTTITRWLDRGGIHSDRLHERDFKGLRCGHIQLAELVGKVRRWGRRVWVWVAQDAQSKAWLAWWVGRRKQADAHRLIHRVKAVQADDHVPAYSSDGLNQYFYGLTAHYGQWVAEEGRRKPVWKMLPQLLYGQLRKRKRGYRLKHVYTKMLCGARAMMEATLQALALSGQIQTAFVERLNLTIRHLLAALRRRTWAVAYTERSLRRRVALAAAYYNYCRTHQSLRVAMGAGRYRGRTPAMALGVTGHCWSVLEFLTHPVY